MMMLLPAVAATLTVGLASVFSHRFWPHRGDWAAGADADCPPSPACGQGR